VQTIAATTTRTGLRVHAELDTSTYDTGVKISDRQMGALPLTRHAWHGDWNYALCPEACDRSAMLPIRLTGPARILCRSNTRLSGRPGYHQQA
jgi:Rhodopirellula transposase DDE domain